jgi:CPA2 family monovalent cation:H+ antiporter-2
VGLAVALSSTMLVVKILQDKKTLSSLHGQLMLGFLLVQDIAVIIALPLLAAGYGNLNVDFLQFLLLKGIFLVAVVALLSRNVFPRLYRIAAGSPELLYLTALATCFGFIGLAYLLNISLAIGAFLAGLAIARLPYNVEAVASIRGLRDFFVTIFFVALGTQLNFNIGSVDISLIISVLLLVFIYKPLVFYLVTQFAGYGSQTSSRVAFGLTQLSEFSLILLLQGKASGVVPDNVYSLLLLIAAGSMVVTPYLMDWGPIVHDWIRKKSRFGVFSHFPLFSRKIKEMESVPVKFLHDHVIILGGGRSGKYLASELKRKYHVVVVDHDPQMITYFRAKGVFAVYGNAHNTEILEKMHVDKARLLVCALPDMDESLFVVDFVKHHFQKVKVFVKANYYEDALKLYKAGADYVILTEIVGGFVFLEQVEHFLKKGKLMNPPNMIKLKEKSYEEREATHGVKNLL